MNDFYELGTREKPLPAPAHVVWESLHEPQRPSARAWLHLGRGEVEPRVIEAEAEVPKAIAAAFREGKLGVMDYYNMQNVISDTHMRDAIAGDSSKNS
mgnify:CR=1 FL=1